MTGFHQMQNLHAYSGGTVRDSHPVIYSPAGLLPHLQALKWNINLLIEYHSFLGLSIEIRQSKRQASRSKNLPVMLLQEIQNYNRQIIIPLLLLS